MSHDHAIGVDVRLEMNDLFPLFFWIYFRRLGWVFVPVMLISIFGVILALLGYRGTNGDSNLQTIVIPIVFCSVFAVGLPFLSARSTLKSSKIIQGTMHYGFSESGMDSSAVGASSHIDWVNVQKVVETRDVLLIYPSKRIMNVIPKRCFADAESLESVRQLIRERVTGKIKLRSVSTLRS